MIDFVPPALILLAGALLIGPARGMLRTAVVLLTPLLTLAGVWQVPDGVVLTLDFLQYPIEPIEGSPVRDMDDLILAISDQEIGDRVTLTVLRDGEELNLTDDGMVGQQIFAGEATRLAYMTDEAVEGRDAFLEKRVPDWSAFPWYF